MSAAYDLLITANETNHHHGVGIFLQRLFGTGPGFICLRSTTMYGGQEPFGDEHLELKSRFMNTTETEARLKTLLAGRTIRRILCVPYYRSEFVHAIAVKKLTGAPLCTYLMDDQNVFAPHVADHWVAELLKNSDLCLGISPELCAAYSHKFGRPVHLLPPVLEKQELLTPCYWQPVTGEPIRAAMIGNIWTASRFQQLRKLLRDSGLHIDWYGNGPQAAWLPDSPEAWESDNIRCLGHLPEEDLVASLASYPFIIVPSGSLDKDDDNIAFSRLSLPSRLLFLHGRTDTPVLVLGSPETAAGRFVTALKTGVSARYEQSDLRKKLHTLTTPRIRQEMRRNVRAAAGKLSMENAGEWIWQSLAAKQPVPAPFHDSPAFTSHGTPAWIGRITPARPRNTHPTPPAAETFQDDHLRAFAHIRASHWKLLTDSGLPVPASDQIELTQLLQWIVFYLLKRALPAGGKILYLDPHPPLWLAQLPSSIVCYSPADIGRWIKSGFALDAVPMHPLGIEKNAAPAAPEKFDAIVSAGWLNQVTTPVAMEEIAAFFAARTVTHGLHLHACPGVLNRDYFWTGPAHDYLQKRFRIQDWPVIDDILNEQDLYAMSERAYDSYWRASTGKPYAEFGQAIGLTLAWRQAPARTTWNPAASLRRWWGALRPTPVAAHAPGVS
ncbi:hypothetical protein CMV30_12640 [Nibricoccus aquaticus]|uniref:Glycosyltransferase n=1 Tax=Nibricoccus aquaticus TaxID=2576891 RepID=A0A290QC16_9BACT|nr:hypothetical protein [Nibricoccus aquaticus]ATC64740.1 hypothetical protein CMV30_12640 [Nibricoccus aquaticus]